MAIIQGSGIDQATWSRYENGAVPELSLNTAVRLASLVGTTVGALLGESELVPQPDVIAAQRRIQGIRSELEALDRDLQPFVNRAIEENRKDADPKPEDPRGPRLLFPWDQNVASPSKSAFYTELPVVRYAPVGKERQPEAFRTGEKVSVSNPVARGFRWRKASVVKVTDDSMERADGSGYQKDDFVVVAPLHPESLQDGDVAYVLLNDAAFLRILRFDRAAKTNAMQNIRLEGLNPKAEVIPVTDSDSFSVIGTEMYRIPGKGLG